MPQWNYQPYQGINSGLLQSQVNAPSKNAAGLNSLMSGLNPGIQSLIQSLVQSGQLNQLLKGLPQQNQGQQPQQPNMMQQPGGGGAMPNPMNQQMGRQTSMLQDPLGILGG